MSSLLGAEMYYQKFIELQDKLRKSEEDRLKLEIKFNEMVQTTRDEKQEHYRKLRGQYKRFVQEDRRRQERNEAILNALERVECRSSMLSAKTERLKFLRQQYQNYVNQIRKSTSAVHSEMRDESSNAVLPEYGRNSQSADSVKLSQYKKDIVDKYLENLAFQKSTMDNFEPSTQRYPFTMTMSDAKMTSNDELLYGVSEGFAKRDALGPAISVADEIMNAIHLQKMQDLKSSDSNRVGNDATEYTSTESGSKKTVAVSLDEVKKGETVVSGNKPKSDIPTVDVDAATGEIATVIPKVLQHEDETESIRIQETKIDRQINDVNAHDYSTDEAATAPAASLNANNVYAKSDQTEYEANVIQQRYSDEQSKQHDEHKESVEQYDKLDYPIQQYDDQNQPVQHDDKNSQLIKKDHVHQGQPVQQYDQDIQQFDESDSAIQQYDEHGQPIQRFDENGQLIQRYDEHGQFIQLYDEHGQPIQQYDEHEQLQQYDANGQFIQQYDESGQPIKQYSEYEQPIQYDEHGQHIQQYDENGQPIIQQYDEHGQFIQQYNEHGQPIQQYDETGQTIQQYDETEQYIQQYDESGQLIQQYDESGQLIQQYDENGLPIQQYDEGGPFVQQYDENGQPIVQQYDKNGQPIQQYDENGEPIQQYGKHGQPSQHYNDEQIIQQYDENGQYDEQGQSIQEVSNTQLPDEEFRTSRIPEESSQLGNDVIESPAEPVTDNMPSENAEPELEEAIETQQCELDVKQDGNDEPKKQTPSVGNVMKMLDTDTESIQQETLVSNDSDFDFSNS